MKRSALLWMLPLIGMASTANAQTWRVTINSGAPVAFPVPTEATYDAGFVDATAPLAFTVQGSGGIAYRNAQVSIRSTSATMGGSKPIADLQWRRSDVATWAAMTTTNAAVQDQDMLILFNTPNWANSILFRTVLDWADDGPGTYNPTLVVTLTISAP